MKDRIVTGLIVTGFVVVVLGYLGLVGWLIDRFGFTWYTVAALVPAFLLLIEYQGRNTPRRRK